MRFFLGTHRPGWLGTVDAPLFLSHRQLRDRRRLPVALQPWGLDSGAYTELALHGRWLLEAEAYAHDVMRFAEQSEGLAWACPMDWLCVPPVLAATGRTVAEHQERTVASVIELRGLVDGTTIAPALQGWSLEDYVRCAELYEEAGIDLRAEPVVCLGSIAPRQGTPEVATIVQELYAMGLALHGLGVKVRGWDAFGGLLASADSVAWSYDARRTDPLPGCTHASCSNCAVYAMRWRDRLLARPAGGQLALA